MAQNFYGSIDLAVLGNIVRTHPNSVRVVTDVNGNTHKYINIDVYERKEVGKNGDTHYIKAGIKKEDKRDDFNYFIGNLKPSQYQEEREATAEDMGDMPF